MARNDPNNVLAQLNARLQAWDRQARREIQAEIDLREDPEYRRLVGRTLASALVAGVRAAYGPDAFAETAAAAQALGSAAAGLGAVPSGATPIAAAAAPASAPPMAASAPAAPAMAPAGLKPQYAPIFAQAVAAAQARIAAGTLPPDTDVGALALQATRHGVQQFFGPQAEIMVPGSSESAAGEGAAGA